MVTRARVISAGGFLVFFCATVACGQDPQARAAVAKLKEQLAADIRSLEAEIKATEADNARHEGGLIKSFLEMRLATLRQTKAMLDQRAAAANYNISLRYAVDGKPFLLPPSASEEASALESEITSLEKEIAHQQQEADRYTGGLVRAMTLSTVAISKQTLALLQQKRLALKYSLPQYVYFADATNGSSRTSTPVRRNGPAVPSMPKADDWEIVEIDSRVTESNSTWWKFAWKLTLRNKSAQPIAFRATIEFQDRDGFVVDDDDSDVLAVSPGATETFTGYDLVTTAAAEKVAKTNAKVRSVR